MVDSDKMLAANHLPAKLLENLAKMPAITVALSGGLDSRFLCHIAKLCGCDVLAIHAKGPHISPADTAWTRMWAKEHQISLVEVEYNPLQYSLVTSNDRERCYFCKKGLLEKIKQVTANNKRILCDGGNADDQKCFRPGLRAVAESGVVSPLAGADMGKKEIRAFAKATGLDFPNQRARPCMLTRFAYGLHADQTMLERLAATEQEIGSLLGEKPGMVAAVDFRLRLLPQPVLQLEKAQDSLYPALGEILKKHGFCEYKIEITPRISGYFDQ